MSLTVRRNGGISFQIVNNGRNLLKIFKRNERKCLHEIGEFCKGKMDYYVAVDTGRLKSNNKYKVTLFNNLILFNETPYAVYQELGKRGRYKYTPFIRPSVRNHLREINAIATRRLGHGI